MAQQATTPEHSGTLFVVATPIGHLGDVTVRAGAVLKSVQAIACEDTRQAAKLLDALNIRTPLVSYHQHTRRGRLEALIRRLQAGEDVALITDAGTPGISDPGGVLVAAARRAGIPVRAVPGPSALAAALSISGIDVSRFLFLGFLPHKKGRKKLIRRMAETEEAAVCFESTHRILKLLKELDQAIGPRPVVLVKEITKTFERVLTGTAGSLLSEFSRDPSLVRGEFVVLVAPAGWKMESAG